MKHVSLSIYDFNRQKVCDLYDSDIGAAGQAHDIILTEEQNGWKEITFELPYDAGGERNFRWDYIKNEYKLRVAYGDSVEFFTVQAPKKTRNGKATSTSVKCAHTAAILKTKNLYKVFDDTNGIGNVRYLAGQVLENTGWTLGNVDTFYERDGVTEKVRSLSSSGKRGAWQLIQDICDLFNAYPVFHDNGISRTVDILALSNKKPITELFIGKNLDAITVEQNSDNIVTRLYVEGEYGNHGYVGIDDADENTAHLPFIMSFDYYRTVGLLGEAQEEAIRAYENGTTGMPGVVASIRAKQANIDAAQGLLNMLWGQCNCMIYSIDQGYINMNGIAYGNVADEDKVLSPGDKILLTVPNIEQFDFQEVTFNDPYDTYAGFDYAIKFITKSSGRIGAQEVAIETKQQIIATLRKGTVDAEAQRKIRELESEITEIKKGTTDEHGQTVVSGYLANVKEAIQDAISLDGLKTQLEQLQANQRTIEANFAAVMGDLLRDGYWSDKNYAVGQEDDLFADAKDRLAEVSKPTVKYTVSLIRLSEQMGFGEDVPEINTAVRLYDEILGLNDDKAYITKRTISLDDERRGSVEISNDGMIAQASKSFEKMIGKVADLADIVDQREAIYERAKAISQTGTLPAEKVEGLISIEDNGIDGGTSGWKTDSDGGLIFESALSSSAFKICGEGFMVANSKTGDNWDWKLYGNGLGFDASELTQGQIDSDRIENGSVGAGKLDSSVGKTLDISQNVTIADPENGLETRMTASETGISTLVTKTGVNDLGDGETLSSKISQNAGQISAKADSSVVTALGTRVSSVELDLDGDAGTIGLKARVQTAEGNIRQAQIDIDGAESAITLKADTVTVDAIRTEISNLKTGVTTASFLKASTMSCSSFYFGGYTVGTRNVNINGTLYTLLVGFD